MSDKTNPAEAQGVGELWHMVAKLAAHVRPTCGELWAEAERLLNRTSPLSAPVEVEWPLSLLQSGRWREVYVGHRCMRLEVTYDYATWERLMEQVEAALAQQPAAAGEEIMVNAAHDVYTLPLQPSGLSSGPRFVVHVPGPEQPAAVDEAMVERAWVAFCESAGSARQGIRAALTAALAAQQGGAR